MKQSNAMDTNFYLIEANMVDMTTKLMSICRFDTPNQIISVHGSNFNSNSSLIEKYCVIAINDSKNANYPNMPVN